MALKAHTVLALFAATAFSQNLDKPALEAYIRRLELLIPSVSIQIDNPKRSAALKGYSEVTAHLSYNGQVTDERFLISNDGETLIRGEAFDLAKTFSKAPGPGVALDKRALEVYLRRLESLIPEVAVRIEDPKPAAFFAGSAALIRGQAFDFKRSPFQANLDKIKTEGEPSFGGSVDAPVTLVMYVDLECPYCKAEMGVVRQNVAQTYRDKVRVVFRDFPIAEPHPWAVSAAVAGRCIYRQDHNKFWNFADWMFSVQSEITEQHLSGRVKQWAAENGIDPGVFSACLESKATEPEVEKSLQEGLSLGVSVTPTSFLNGSILEGTVEWAVLRQLINVELNRLGVPIP
jgi:protein-disulfide isomerase